MSVVEHTKLDFTCQLASLLADAARGNEQLSTNVYDFIASFADAIIESYQVDLENIDTSDVTEESVMQKFKDLNEQIAIKKDV